MNSPMSMYRFKVGKCYQLLVPVFDENDKFYDAGTWVRIVAIAPKVRITSGINKDTKEYFYNAVVASQENDFENRIRENFCTLSPKVRKEKDNGQHNTDAS